MSGDVQSAAVMARRIESAGGLMLGLALGDSWNSIEHGTRVAPAGVATQLTCATMEALVRSVERLGQDLTPEWEHTAYEAYRRWGIRQGIAGISSSQGRSSRGWLEHVPALAERRGSAPTTVAALRRGQPATIPEPWNNSFGAHALLRSLPFGLLAEPLGPAMLVAAASAAGTTHGHLLGAATAHLGAAMVWAAHASPDPLVPTWIKLLDDILPTVPMVTDRIAAAITTALVEPGHPDQLRALAPDRTSASVLTGAAYAAASFSAPGEVHQALGLASTAIESRSTAVATGALLGSRHGLSAVLPLGAARLELACVCTTLATDLAMALTLTPLGLQPDGSEWLSGWAARYPVA